MATRMLTAAERLHFRDQLREARAIALKDAESFEPIVHVLERVGSFLLGTSDEAGSLDKYRPFICTEASRSPLAEGIPSVRREVHLAFYTLYELVRKARNTAMHEGSFARHLTAHAVELSIILEHAFMNDFDKVSHFMVRNPVCAALWQPLSFIRQSMLVNSFSYLPVLKQGNDEWSWLLVSDLALAQYLRLASSQKDLRKRLTQTLGEAADSKQVELTAPRICNPETAITDLINGWD